MQTNTGVFYTTSAKCGERNRKICDGEIWSSFPACPKSHRLQQNSFLCVFWGEIWMQPIKMVIIYISFWMHLDSAIRSWIFTDCMCVCVFTLNRNKRKENYFLFIFILDLFRCTVTVPHYLSNLQIAAVDDNIELECKCKNRKNFIFTSIRRMMQTIRMMQGIFYLVVVETFFSPQKLPTRHFWVN